jgi:hypothetical protein
MCIGVREDSLLSFSLIFLFLKKGPENTNEMGKE